MSGSRILVIAAVVAVATVACSPAASGEQSPKGSGDKTPISAPTAEAGAASIIFISAAWPRVVVRAWDSSTWVESSITPDGADAIGEASRSDATAPPIGPAIMDRATGEVTVVRNFLNSRAQVVSTAGDHNWIAWVEGSLQPNMADWTIYSLDRSSGQIRTLAAAPKTSPNTPWVLLSMSNGVIVWSAVQAPDGVFHVYAVHADGSGVRTIAANAQGPQIVWPWVVYDVKPSAPGQPATLQRQNLETGETERIVGPTDVSYFAYDGEAVAWVSADGTKLFLQSPLNSPPIRLAVGNHLQFVSINQRLVGWGVSTGAFVYDRKLHVIIQLSNLHGLYPVMSDQAVDWLYQPNANANNPYVGTVWRDVNVDQLP